MGLETFHFMRNPPAEQSVLLFFISYSLVPTKFFLLKALSTFLNSMESDVRELCGKLGKNYTFLSAAV